MPPSKEGTHVEDSKESAESTFVISQEDVSPKTRKNIFQKNGTTN